MAREKSIFITGAASGIGRATARLFAGKGWFVGGGDVDDAGLNSLTAEIGSAGCSFHVMDVTDETSVRRAVDAFASQSGGGIDVLFNCAGILAMGPHHEIPLADQKRILDVNVNGMLNAIHAAFDRLRAAPGSRIINMSSASAVYGTPELAVYSAAKFAIRGLTEALNIEFGRMGIHVCDVMAFYVKTPMILDAPVKAGSVARMGVRLEPRDVAAVVWKAAGGRRLHYRVGWLLTLTVFFNWAFPLFRRRMTAFLALSKK